MSFTTGSESLRVLCLDGGGIKGYTSLLILKRIFRTMMAEGQLDEIPKPCNIFDLIVGTSTGGLIAVMLGRLHMSIDECIATYERVGGEVFGKKPHGGKFGKMLKGLRSSSFYDIEILQEEIKKILDSKEIPHDMTFREVGIPSCKVMLCVTRAEISKPDVLRNYESFHPTAENYNCNIWEAASATAAAPMYFKSVQLIETGERWCDGGLRRNNPINEALSELTRERDWKNKRIGCVLSLGTGVAKSAPISSNLASVLKAAVAIMTDSDDIARVFASSELGIELFRTHRYFRFSLPQGMQDLQLDDWKETEKMRALTADYLSYMGNGDLLTRCAKSLLDPDENLQIEIKPKISLIPYHPCTHFIERRIYTESLLKFFRSKTQLAQTFVLWGLGGIGKTQIALSFAQTIQHRLSVFWIRADRFTNFATDYAHVLNELDPASADGTSSNDDLSIVLDKTRRKLEENPNEWLLILDNADDLDGFLGRTPSLDDEGLSMGRFLPRHGRMLITTRDRRFQGTVATASNGMKVDSMSAEESKRLLIGSIPRYLIREGSDTMNQAKQLTEELGHLPLAIAQAAANILEQQLTLAEYVSFYQDKKQRIGLMQSPAHDFQNTDPRNASQSVNITWQISFDVLKERYPLSAVFLTYIGCFHWRNIPRTLLQRLPEFRDLPEPVFIQLTKKPLNLSLVDEQESEPGFIEYFVHPLVHENILGRLTAAEITTVLGSLVESIGPIFPFIGERTDPKWPVIVYLSPHVARIIELCDEVHLSSQSLSILILRMSQFLGVSNIFATAVELAENAKKMGLEEWSSSPEMMLGFTKNLNCQYVNASRLDELEREAREALDWLDSDFVKANMASSRIEMSRISLQSDLSTSLERNKNNAEREELHRKQLATGLVDEWDSKGINIRHNLAHSLFHQKKYEEARVLNGALLEFAETEKGKKEVNPRLYLIMLNLKCLILRSTAQKGVAYKGFVQDSQENRALEEQRQIYEMVFKESLEQLGIEDIDTWKAINNYLGHLRSVFMWVELGPALWEVLSSGIEFKVKAEGKFACTLSNVRATAESYLGYIETSKGNDAESVEKFRTLLQDWITSSGCSDTICLESFGLETHLSNRGVELQNMGLFEEAERLHLKSIEMCLGANQEVPEVFRYNLMLAIARQGRIEEAKAYSEQYRADLEGPQAVFGTLEQRMERDRTDREIYDQAQDFLDTGQLISDEWKQENERVLGRAVYRYGKLEPRPLAVVLGQKKHRGKVKNMFGLGTKPKENKSD